MLQKTPITEVKSLDLAHFRLELSDPCFGKIIVEVAHASWNLLTSIYNFNDTKMMLLTNFHLKEMKRSRLAATNTARRLKMISCNFFSIFFAEQPKCLAEVFINTYTLRCPLNTIIYLWFEYNFLCNVNLSYANNNGI